MKIAGEKEPRKAGYRGWVFIRVANKKILSVMV